MGMMLFVAPVIEKSKEGGSRNMPAFLRAIPAGTGGLIYPSLCQFYGTMAQLDRTHMRNSSYHLLAGLMAAGDGTLACLEHQSNSIWQQRGPYSAYWMLKTSSCCRLWRDQSCSSGCQLQGILHPQGCVQTGSAWPLPLLGKHERLPLGTGHFPAHPGKMV